MRESYTTRLLWLALVMLLYATVLSQPAALKQSCKSERTVEMYFPNVPFCPTTVTDYDGNIYRTVQIGNQCWMSENLKTTHYSAGGYIPQGDEKSFDLAYWYYPDGDSSYIGSYGLLYNWMAVMGGASPSDRNPSGVRGVCPRGWHLPSDPEWTQLEQYVSNHSNYICGNRSDFIAKALASSVGWELSSDSCNIGNDPFENNATGFSVVPAGHYNGNFYDLGYTANFWSATQGSNHSAYYRYFNFYDAFVGRYEINKDIGFSVRCLHD